MVKSLPGAPPPGPATFIVKCLEALVHVGPPHGEGLSHLLISALCQSDRSKWPGEDASIARRLGGSLFCDALVGKIQMESRIVVKLPGAFGFELKDIGDILILGQHDEAVQLEAAKEFVELYVLDLLKRRLYTGAVSLLKNFNLQTCDYQQSLIAAIVDDGQASLAVDWASYLGKEMLTFLVQHCTEMGMYKVAYKVVQQYKLEADFPDAYHIYRQSSLCKLVGKGLWDVAQTIAEGDTKLIDYLVTLALEENNAEKVVELCEHFHLDHVQIASEVATSNGGSHYLQLASVMSEENIHWIDTHEGLVFAERVLFGVNVVGIDCEWKADTMKGVEPSKVSILQVASSDVVFVLDLITLLKNCQNSLNDFVKYLFHTPDILKIGYAVHNDLERLSRSFPEIQAFGACESVLDLQKVFGRQQIKGGLSGLAKGVLGSCLNKQSRMSDWEIRPLSKKQLHYAALDAMVLLPIFDSVAHQPDVVPETQDWKVHTTSFRVMPKHQRKLDDFDVKELEQPSSRGTSLNSHEDLVLATCELLGLPIPGLLKAELFHFTKAAKLPPPVYKAATMAPFNETAFYSTVTVAGTTYSGFLAPSKKDAEFWAAQVALRKLNIGLLEVEIV